MSEQKHYSQEEFKKYLQGVTDGTVKLQCERHYWTAGFGKVPPSVGCQSCIYAHFMWLYASTPESKQGEMLDRFEKSVRDACQMEDLGKFDLTLLDHPEIEIAHE